MKVYNEGGKARKKCLCGVYVHARSADCPKCGHIFNKDAFERKQNKPEITTFDHGGQGKKQCRKCLKYCGVRTTICPCGESFDKKPTEYSHLNPEQIKEFISNREYKTSVGVNQNFIVVYTPAGKQNKPQSDSLKDIYDWFDLMFMSDGKIFHPDALKYRARQYKINTDLVDDFIKLKQAELLIIEE